MSQYAPAPGWYKDGLAVNITNLGLQTNNNISAYCRGVT